jgi:hypothetical protein
MKDILVDFICKTSVVILSIALLFTVLHTCVKAIDKEIEIETNRVIQQREQQIRLNIIKDINQEVYRRTYQQYMEVEKH